jgi:hypothetical protein
VEKLPQLWRQLQSLDTFFRVGSYPQFPWLTLLSQKVIKKANQIDDSGAAD